MNKTNFSSNKGWEWITHKFICNWYVYKLVLYFNIYVHGMEIWLKQIIFQFSCVIMDLQWEILNFHTKTSFFWFCAFVTVASRTTNTNALLLHSVATDWDHHTTNKLNGALRLWNCLLFLCGFNAPCYRTHAHYYLLHFTLIFYSLHLDAIFILIMKFTHAMANTRFLDSLLFIVLHACWTAKIIQIHIL